MKAVCAQDLAKAVDGVLVYGDGSTQITSVSTNSKEITAGALFVPIVGERVDAHKFINMALEKGAVATLTARACEAYIPGKVYIKVEDTIAALQKAAAWYRSLFELKLVGVTGSVGKTTTKEMIAAALETQYQVLKTKGNMNSQIGLPLMMFELEDSTQIAVIEMGMSEVGEMHRLATIAKPDVVVMTNIGVSHIGQLGSQKNIRKEKMNIIDECAEGTPVFVNGEDPLLQELVQFSKDAREGRTIASELFDGDTREKLACISVEEYGSTQNCEYRAEQVQITEQGQTFVYASREGKELVQLSVLGEHNVKNATVALAIAQYFKIPAKQAKKGLAAYQPIAMRGQIYQSAGRKILDDTYNASPDSMKSGVAVLLDMAPLKRRIVVFGDVLELGEASRTCHYQVGSYIAKTQKNGRKIDLVVTVGTQARFIGDAIKDAGVSVQVEPCADNTQAIAFLQENTCSGDGILVKGSRGMHMEEIVEALKNM